MTAETRRLRSIAAFLPPATAQHVILAAHRIDTLAAAVDRLHHTIDNLVAEPCPRCACEAREVEP